MTNSTVLKSGISFSRHKRNLASNKTISPTASLSPCQKKTDNSGFGSNLDSEYDDESNQENDEDSILSTKRSSYKRKHSPLGNKGAKKSLFPNDLGTYDSSQLENASTQPWPIQTQLNEVIKVN